MKITKKNLLNPKCNLYSSLARCAALFSAITFGYASYGQEVSQIYFKTPTSTQTSHLNRVTNWCTDADKTTPFEGSFTDMGVQYDANCDNSWNRRNHGVGDSRKHIKLAQSKPVCLGF